MVTVSVSVERTMPRFWVAMRLMRALEESAERSTMRLSLVVLASVIWVLRVAFPWSAATAADVRATRQAPRAKKTRAQATTALTRARNSGATPRRARASSPPPETTSKEGRSCGRAYPLSMYSSFATAEPWYLI